MKLKTKVKVSDYSKFFYRSVRKRKHSKRKVIIPYYYYVVDMTNLQNPRLISLACVDKVWAEHYRSSLPNPSNYSIITGQEAIDKKLKFRTIPLKPSLTSLDLVVLRTSALKRLKTRHINPIKRSITRSYRTKLEQVTVTYKGQTYFFYTMRKNPQESSNEFLRNKYQKGKIPVKIPPEVIKQTIRLGFTNIKPNWFFIVNGRVNPERIAYERRIRELKPQRCYRYGIQHL